MADALVSISPGPGKGVLMVLLPRTAAPLRCRVAAKGAALFARIHPKHNFTSWVRNVAIEHHVRLSRI